jgi:hypothetical protein
METFVMICFVLVAAVVLFWVVIWPMLLLLGSTLAVVCGAFKGFRDALRPRL